MNERLARLLIEIFSSKIRTVNWNEKGLPFPVFLISNTMPAVFPFIWQPSERALGLSIRTGQTAFSNDVLVPKMGTEDESKAVNTVLTENISGNPRRRSYNILFSPRDILPFGEYLLNVVGLTNSNLKFQLYDSYDMIRFLEERISGNETNRTDIFSLLAGDGTFFRHCLVENLNLDCFYSNNKFTHAKGSVEVSALNLYQFENIKTASKVGAIL